MLIMAFARTTAALVARVKKVTRRQWSDGYHEMFTKALAKAIADGEPGLRVQAWSASPHRGGTKVGEILVKSVTREPTHTMPGSDWNDEGFEYMAKNGILLDKERSCVAQWMLWRRDRDLVTSVIRFEVDAIEEGITPEMFFGVAA